MAGVMNLGPCGCCGGGDEASCADCVADDGPWGTASLTVTGPLGTYVIPKILGNQWRDILIDSDDGHCIDIWFRCATPPTVGVSLSVTYWMLKRFVPSSDCADYLFPCSADVANPIDSDARGDTVTINPFSFPGCPVLDFDFELENDTRDTLGCVDIAGTWTVTL